MEKINRRQIEKLMRDSNVFCILPFKHTLLQPRGTATICCMSPDPIPTNDNFIRWDKIDEQREYKGDGSDVLVSKDGEAIVIDATEILEHLADGWEEIDFEKVMQEAIRWEEVDFEKKIWQGDTYQRIRKNMLTGKKSYECRNCYKVEDSGSESYRNGQNKFELKHPEINNINIKSGNDFEQPVDWDIRLSRLCNLMCRMCNRNESSQIAKEADSNPDILLDYKSRATTFNYGEKDATYILKTLPNMKRLKILGGEPTLDPQVQLILDEAIKIGKTDLRLDITSNLTNVTDKWLESLGRFKEVQLQFSIDGVGKTNEYIRWPSKWIQIEENIEKYLTFKGETNTNWYLSFHQTVSIYNIFDFWKVHEWIESLRTKDKYNRIENLPEVSWHTYLVHYPTELDPSNVLQGNQKKEILEKFKAYRPNIKDTSGFTGVQSIVTLLEDTTEAKEIKSCKYRTEVIDKIRNVNIKDYIPAVATVLNSG